MSRWIDNFENHDLQSVWGQIKDIVSELSVPDESVISETEELARLKKAIAFLDKLLESIDPEFIPLKTWDNFYAHATQCLQEINKFIDSQNVGSLQNANASIDNLLTYIRPYMVVTGKAAQAARYAFSKYSETVNSSLNAFKAHVDEIVEEIETAQEHTKELEESSDASFKKIDELRKEFFVDTEDQNSVSTQVTNLVANLEEWYADVSSYHESLVGGEAGETIKDEVEATRQEIEASRKAIKALLASAEGQIDDLNAFYKKIFGEENEDGEIEGGLKQELKKRQEDLDSFDAEQKKRYNALVEQIEGLLPGATSAGLASAYYDMKKSFDEPVRKYTTIFNASMVALFVVGLTFATRSIGLSNIEFVDVSDWSALGSNILIKLPLFLPIVWLAMFASRRRSEAQRLQQEYAHKEALAKSYDGFKQQVLALGHEETALMDQLIQKAIDAVSFNASGTLDGRHGDKVPVQEIAEGVVNLMKKQST